MSVRRLELGNLNYVIREMYCIRGDRVKSNVAVLPRNSWLLIALVIALPISTASSIKAGQDIPLPRTQASRWLEVRQIKGNVTVQLSRAAARPARTGDRLQKVGDQVTTAEQSGAVLAIDDGIAVVRLTEGTNLQIKQLQSRQGGKITQLYVSRGLARLQVRPLTNPNSKLQIQTPAGIAGVRGTEFGVSVTPNGKTTVATAEGAVSATAVGETVLVNAGLYSLVIAGQPPTPPRPLTVNLALKVERLAEVPLPADRDVPVQGRVVGQIDPANSIYFNGQSIDTDVDGRFDATAVLLSDRSITAVVRSPVGQEQRFQITIPLDVQPYLAPK